MKILLLIFSLPLLLIVSCSSSEDEKKSELQAQELVMEPATETTTEILPDSNVFTCILFNSDSIYSYRGNNLNNGTFYAITGKNSYRTHIQELKKRAGDSLVVIIKPTAQSSDKTTVDVLDEMTINHVAKYAMVKLNAAEESFFQTAGFDWTPPEPVAVESPTSVTTQQLPPENSFLIEIRKDKSVWYQMMSPVIKMAPQKINEPITKNLKTILAGYERSLPDKKKTYLIKGDRDATYTSFEQVIKALKETNIYKYNLVTAEN